MDFVTLPTTSLFADWSKHCHVTFIEITSFIAHSFTAFLVVVTMCYIAYYLTNATTSTN